MSARQVRQVMGHAGKPWKQTPAPVWSYPTDNSLLSDGTLAVYFSSDSLVQRIVYPKGQHPD